MIETRLLLPDHLVPSRAADADDDAWASPDGEKAEESAKKRIARFILSILSDLSNGLSPHSAEQGLGEQHFLAAVEPPRRPSLRAGQRRQLAPVGEMEPQADGFRFGQAGTAG